MTLSFYRRFALVVLAAGLAMFSAPGAAQCTLGAVDLVSPRNGVTIVVGAGVEDIPFMPVAIPDCEMDTTHVSFDCDGLALGYITAAPYTLAASPFAELGFGLHSVVATANRLSTTGSVVQTNEFNITQAGAGIDVDLNGYPDDPFAALAGNGFQWVSQTPVEGAAGLRRVGLCRWAGSGGTANPQPLVIPLADSLNPARCVTVFMPPTLLLPGEIGILMVTAADDLDTLLGPEMLSTGEVMG
ncbi:MAG: hypothetical protein NTZ09_18005, partial [Candidatus Hydrogenedentes bacterium]|nr:hypothetical protein [Candidatus Hydrogenedentota bacterium]